MKRLELIGLEGIGEVRTGDSVGALICDACSRQNFSLLDDDVLVIAQKIVSKAEERTICLDDVQPSARAIELAEQLDKEPALVEVILRESRQIVRMGGRALIVETHHGFICANAGVDQSNVGIRQVALLPKDPDGSARAIELAEQLDKEPALVEVILRESRQIVRMGGRALIVETHHGFICANAGVDQSNVGIRQVALLPKDPDGSARAIRDEIQQRTGKKPAIIISDSFGRPWRVGTVDVAVGVSGLKTIKDERGLTDRYGYQLKAAVAAVADEIAAAAELVMGKRDGVPVVIVRGCEIDKEEGSVKELLRPEAEDLFRRF